MNGTGIIPIKGKLYVVPKATDGDVLALRNRLAKLRRTRPYVIEPSPMDKLAAILESPGWKLLSPETRAAKEKELIDEAAALTLGKKKPAPEEVQAEQEREMEEIGELLMEPAHCAFFAWTLLRKEQPTLQLADMEQAIDQDNVAQVLVELLEESGLKKSQVLVNPGATGSPAGPPSIA